MSRKQITRKQHYIPRLLLKNFCDNDGKLAVYNTKHHTFSRKTPAQICYRNYLYETKYEFSMDGVKYENYFFLNQIEQKLSELEAEATDIIRKIISLCNDDLNKEALICSSAEKEKLLRFILNLFLRNPIIMKEYSLDKPQSNYLSIPDIREMKELLDSYDMSDIANQMIVSIQKLFFIFSDTLKNKINTNNITFFVSKESRLVFSDLPLVFGAVNSDSYVVFAPISPYCCVHYYENKTPHIFRRNKITSLSKEQTISLNCMLVSAAQHDIRYIYAKDKREIEETMKYIGENNDKTRTIN